MNLSKWIIGAFLIIGIVLFLGLGFKVIFNGNRNEAAMYLFSGLFVTIGSAIAILLDVKSDSTLPSDQGQQGMFNKLGKAITFSDSPKKSNNLIGLGYALSYLVIGVLIIYRFVEKNTQDEYLSTLASAFAGLMLAVIGKYAFVKDGNSMRIKSWGVLLIGALTVMSPDKKVVAQVIEFDLAEIKNETSFNRKGSEILIIRNIKTEQIVKVSSKKSVYIPYQPFEYPKVMEDGKRSETFVINLNKAASVDVTITVSELDKDDKEINPVEHIITIYKEKYWDFSLSAGLFGSSIKSKRYEWQTLNQNDLISDLDTTGVFKITESNRMTRHAGLNTLSHVLYQCTPSFGVGLFAGIGVSFTEKVVPQIQFGLSTAFLKDKRVLINLGLSSAYGNTRLSNFISTTSTYSHVAAKQITLDDHIEKGFGKLGPTLSVTYQITN